MKVKRTVHMKIELLDDQSGVLTLMAGGLEMESVSVYFGGNSCAALGESCKMLINRSKFAEELL